MVNHFVSAKLFRFCKLRFGARCGDHARACILRELDRRAAHSASRAEHKHRLARPKLRAPQQHVPRRQEHEWNSRRLFKGKLAGNRQHIHGRRFHIFGATPVVHLPEEGVLAAEIIPAGETLLARAVGDARLQQNLSAYLGARHRFADLRDLASDVASGNVRQRNRHAGNAPAQPQIEVVQRAGTDADQNFVRAHLRLRRVGVTQHFRPAVLGINDRLHAHPHILPADAGI